MWLLFGISLRRTSEQLESFCSEGHLAEKAWQFEFRFAALYLNGSVRSGKRRYNVKLWKTFTDCFNCLPVAAIIDEKILCMHGGLSPELNSMDQVRRIVRPTDVPDTGKQ